MKGNFSEKVIIVNFKRFEEIKKRFKRGGERKLSVFSDFERTITKFLVNNEKIYSLTSILRNSPEYLGKEYSERAKSLFRKYFPFEKNFYLPMELRKKEMENWWKEHMRLLIKFGLTKETIKRVVKESKLKLRRGAKKFFSFLDKKEIPLVIISATGLGREAIKIFLEKEKILFPNIFIISNDFFWNENGEAKGVKTPVLHSLKKEEIELKNYPLLYQKIKKRRNLILLGDMIEDIKMAKIFNYENLLKIGFLNDSLKRDLKEYKKNFDCVIINDGSMEFVNKILKEICD